jgi:NAD(P)H dehydrogenase (quinone)
MKNRILITGATGKIGNRVAEILKLNQPLRLMSRNPGKLSGFPDAEKVKGDYSHIPSLEAAFQDIHAAFIVSGYAPPGERALLHKNAIEAAVKAKVPHVVYLSFQGAAPASKFPMSRDHYQTEEYIKQSGLAYTLLRDNFYMDLIPEMFGEEHLMRGPGGQGKVAWVSREDVSQCVAAVLADPVRWPGTYDLTGPEALTLAQTAERLTGLLGKAYIYEEESVEDGIQWRSRSGAPDWEVATWIGSYQAIAAGEVAKVSNAVMEISGRKPFTLEAYFTQFPAAFN